MRQPATGEKKDVFVSYSRADEEFASRLVDELARRGKEAWIDLEGIPPTAEWLDEIHVAIEAADAFLFVISPHSAASEMCRAELAHAEKHGKLIVPLNLAEVDRTILPSALADRQWITFDGRPFEESLDTLVGALNTDLPWLRAHTQWLGKAREWESHGRDRSFLLRGSELRAAEAWLTTPGAAEKDPPATPLQNEYVFASRQAASRRQRGVLVAVAIALLVTAVLAVAAILQRDRAISERETAVSELLANLSLQRLGTDLDTALLLGVAAYEVKETPDARNALLVGAQRAEHVQGMVRTLPGATVSAADLSADGRILATAAGQQLVVWDLPAKRRLASATGTREIPALALSADGSLLAVAREGARVELYDVQSAGLEPRGRAHAALEDVVSLAFSPSQPVLAAGTGGGEIVLLDVERSSVTVHEADRPQGFEGLPMPVAPLAFDATGERLAAGSPFGLHTVRLGEGQLYEGLTELAGVDALDFAGGARLAVVSEGRVSLVEAGTGTPVCGPRLSGLTAVDVDARGHFVLAGRGGVLETGADVCKAASARLGGQRGRIELVRFTGSEDELVSVGSDSLAVRWSPTSSSLAAPRPSRSDRVRDVVWGVADDELVIAADSGVWLLAAGEAPRPLDGSRAGIAALAAAAEAQTIAAAAEEDVSVWRGAEYAPQAPHELPGRTILNVTLGSGGSVLAAGTERGSVHLFDLDGDGGNERLPGTGSGSVSALAFGLRDDLLAVGFNTGELAVWRIDSDPPREVVTRPGSTTEGRIESLAFSPDGDLLAVGASDGSVAFWEVEGGREIPLPSRHAGAVTDLAFAATGELVSSDEQGTLQVWDLDTGRPLGEGYDTGGERVEGLDMSPSRDLLAAASRSGSVMVVRSILWSPEAARAQTCAIAGRELSEEERSLLAPGLELPEIC